MGQMCDVFASSFAGGGDVGRPTGCRSGLQSAAKGQGSLHPFGPPILGLDGWWFAATPLALATSGGPCQTGEQQRLQDSKVQGSRFELTVSWQVVAAQCLVGPDGW
eukprot:scaffold475498_cov14-Prasinocladus_malaysianus.AAC.1